MKIDFFILLVDCIKYYSYLCLFVRVYTSRAACLIHPLVKLNRQIELIMQFVLLMKRGRQKVSTRKRERERDREIEREKQRK